MKTLEEVCKNFWYRRRRWYLVKISIAFKVAYGGNYRNLATGNRFSRHKQRKCSQESFKKSNRILWNVLRCYKSSVDSFEIELGRVAAKAVVQTSIKTLPCYIRLQEQWLQIVIVEIVGVWVGLLLGDGSREMRDPRMSDITVSVGRKTPWQIVIRLCIFTGGVVARRRKVYQWCAFWMIVSSKSWSIRRTASLISVPCMIMTSVKRLKNAKPLRIWIMRHMLDYFDRSYTISFLSAFNLARERNGVHEGTSLGLTSLFPDTPPRVH